MKRILVLAFMFLVLEVSGIAEYAAAADRFVKNTNDTVTDTQTGLMWAAKDNGENINWQDAKSYCENYRGGGYTDWRMPTRGELAALSDKGISYKPSCNDNFFTFDVHLTQLITLSCYYVWASEYRDPEAAGFDFINSLAILSTQSGSEFLRALPVRSGEAILSTGIPTQSTDMQTRSKGKDSGEHTIISPILGAKFVLIPPGTFTMGDSDYGPPHQVTISKEFYMQTTEVTQGQWKKVMGNNPSFFKDCGDDCPVEQVSWYDVQNFIKKLNSMEGTDKYRLPSEAQWEYGARSGSKQEVYAGTSSELNLGDYAWIGYNSEKKTHPVGQKKPNTFGLHDMSGNVWEWVQDWHGDYPIGSATDPAGPASGLSKIHRGSCWGGFAFSAAHRGGYGAPDSWSDIIGFRLFREK